MRTLFEMGFRNSFGPMMGQDSGWGPGGPPVVSLTDGTTPTTPTKPADTGTDWAKLISQGITAAGAGYSAYSKEQIAKMTEQTKRLQPGMPGYMPGMLQQQQSQGVSPNTMFLVGGLAVAGIITAIALKG